jgi:hypothetical protein
MNVSTALIEVLMKGKSKLPCSIVGLVSGQSHEFQPVLLSFRPVTDNPVRLVSKPTNPVIATTLSSVSGMFDT